MDEKRWLYSDSNSWSNARGASTKSLHNCTTQSLNTEKLKQFLNQGLLKAQTYVRSFRRAWTVEAVSQRFLALGRGSPRGFGWGGWSGWLDRLTSLFWLLAGPPSTPLFQRHLFLIALCWTGWSSCFWLLGLCWRSVDWFLSGLEPRMELKWFSDRYLKSINMLDDKREINHCPLKGSLHSNL